MKTNLDALRQATFEVGDFKSLNLLARLHRMSQDQAKFIQIVGGVERAELDGAQARYSPRQFLAARAAVEAECKALDSVDSAERISASEAAARFDLAPMELNKLIYRYDLDETEPHSTDLQVGDRTFNSAVFMAALRRQMLLDATLDKYPHLELYSLQTVANPHACKKVQTVSDKPVNIDLKLLEKPTLTMHAPRQYSVSLVVDAGSGRMSVPNLRLTPEQAYALRSLEPGDSFRLTADWKIGRDVIDPRRTVGFFDALDLRVFDRSKDHQTARERTAAAIEL